MPAPGGSDRRLVVYLKTPDGIEEVPADRVIARLGAIPPRRFLESCGIEFPDAAPTALPELTEQYETNVPGLRIVGALAGYPLIKQALNQGHDVIEFINGNPIKPADHELLDFQFRGLPWELDVDEVIKMLMQRVPMFRHLNTLNFRELVIESTIYSSYADPASEQEMRSEMGTLAKQIESQYADQKLLPNRTRILAGEIELESAGIPGGTRTLRQGEFFGEMSLIAGQPRRERARVGRDSVLMETPRRTILKLMNSNPTVREGIVWIYTARELQRHFVPDATVDQLRQIVNEIVPHNYSPGDVLWEQDSEAQSLHIVQNGTVALYRKRRGKNVVVAQVRAGELLGEMSVFGDSSHDDTALATVFTETLEISKALFRQLMQLDYARLEEVQEVASNRILSRVAWEVRPESEGLLHFLLDDGLGEATNALFIDETLCIGCDNCEKACAETHGGVKRLERKSGHTYSGVHVPVTCRHCQQPHCMKDCPPNAINRSATGEVYIDQSCIGCGNCEANCPYDAIKLAYEPPAKPGLLSWIVIGLGPGPGEDTRPRGAKPDTPAKAVKCDACMNLPSGPACVSACPTGAAQRIGPDPITQVIGRSG